MTKSYCVDDSTTLSSLSDVSEAYKQSLLTAHEQVKADDWKSFNDTVNEGFGKLDAVVPNISVDRPPDGSDFYESEFYTDFLTPLSIFLRLADVKPTAAMLAEYNFKVNSGDPVITNINNVRTLADAVPLTTETDINNILVYDLRNVGNLWTAGALYNFAQQLSSSQLNNCPEDLDAFTKQLYLTAMQNYFKKKTVDRATATSQVAATVMGALAVPSVPFSKPLASFGAGVVSRLLFDKVFDDAVKEIERAIGIEAENVFAEQQLYREQCFVLSQISDLVSIKQEESKTRLPYEIGKKIVKNDTAVLAATTPEGMFDPSSLTGNAPLLMRGDPFAFMNKLIQYPTTNNLFNLTTAQISSLVPTIRLYRVNTDPKTGKDIGEVEITFDTNPAVPSYTNTANGNNSPRVSALDLFKNKNKRGFGVGLKNFDFTFHGSDPFAVKKAIEAKLTIFATSFGDLIQQRGGYKYADLALKTGKSPSEVKNKLPKIQQQNLDKLNFRLKAIVGWAIPNKDVANFDKSEKDAVNDSFSTLNLTPTIHDFNFDEMGGVTFTINYLAYIEDYFNQSTFSIFSDPEIEAARISRRLFFEFLDTQRCDEESLEMIKEASAKVLLREKSKSFSSILKSLRRNKKIYNYNVSYDEIGVFLQTGKFDKKPSLQTNNTTSSRSIIAAYKTFSKAKAGDVNNTRERIINLTNTSKEQNIISFFFISDLLDVIMDKIDKTLDELNSDPSKTSINFFSLLEQEGFMFDSNESSRMFVKIQANRGVYESFMQGEQIQEYIKSLLRAKEEFKRFRIVLGPIEIVDPFNRNKRTFCSIGDIPLSLNYFTEFLTQKMVAKDEVYYPITNFVKDLVNGVIKNFLNDEGCFDFNIKQKLKFNSNTITAFNEHSSVDDITHHIKNNSTIIPPLLKTSGPVMSPIHSRDRSKEINYYIFYAGRAYPIEYMSGDRSVDYQNGIYHYVLGKDRGIVKNISLNKTDMKGLKELRFEKEGFDGLTQLREVYNADIECFLNVQAYPGMYIYIDPRGFSPEAGINYSQFGIGGYYMITRAEHSIGIGKADTKIVAKWVADTNGRVADNGETEADKVRSDEETEPRKCINISRRGLAKTLKEQMKIDSVFDLYKITPLGAAYTLGKSLAKTGEATEGDD